MPPPLTLKIAEIFASIQGEGLRQGEPTVFIRLAGCNLRCSFCDTKRAWTGGRVKSIERIAAEAARLRKSRPAEWIVLTGGEPLLQDVGPLVRLLKDAGHSSVDFSHGRVRRNLTAAKNAVPRPPKIQIETNGIIYRRLPCDWYTISPKPPDYAFHPEYRARAREVKLVASKELTYAVVARIRDAFPPSVPLLLQPESNTAASRAKALRLLRRAAKEGRTNIRLSLQMHKILRVP
jgi:7-carboxy-7-deazaguanine synthase